MKGFHFFADLPGTLKQPEQRDNRFADDVPVFAKRTTRKQLREAADRGERCNVAALLLGHEHQNHDYTQEALCATFGHADSDTSLGSVSRDYLRGCRRIDEALARKLHPRLFARLDSSEHAYPL